MLTRSFYSRVIMSETGGPSRTPVPTELTWSAGDPLSVVVRFTDPAGSASVVWVVGRDLLNKVVGTVSGKPACVGKGDVKGYSPTDLRTILCLTSPEGHSHISMPRLPIETFLNQAYRDFPVALEDAAIGRALDALLRELPASIEEYEEQGRRDLFDGGDVE